MKRSVGQHVKGRFLLLRTRHLLGYWDLSGWLRAVMLRCRRKPTALRVAGGRNRLRRKSCTQTELWLRCKMHHTSLASHCPFRAGTVHCTRDALKRKKRIAKQIASLVPPMSRVDSLLYSSSETRQVSELLKIGRCVYLKKCLKTKMREKRGRDLRP